MSHFGDRLAEKVRQRGNPVCVGLDPRFGSLPEVLREGAGSGDLAARAVAYRQFCLEVLDVVAPLVPIVKPQAAFFEELGPPGMQALADVIAAAQSLGVLVILDAKRGDIGSTAVAYAQGMLGPESAWKADALTINPYLGDDSLRPFVDVASARGSGLFVLVKTSNPGGAMLQDLTVDDGRTLYQHVAAHVEQLASETAGSEAYGSVGAVVGATYPAQLAELRAAMPHAWLLVPGYGSQGAGAADVAGAFDPQGLGAVVNNSRGIIFAHSQPQYAHLGTHEWQVAVEGATRAMIDQLRAATPAGAL